MARPFPRPFAALSALVIASLIGLPPARSALPQSAAGLDRPLAAPDRSTIIGFLGALQNQGFPGTTAQYDLGLASSLMTFARQLRAGRLDPAAINGLWALHPTTGDLDQSLHLALSTGQLDRWIAELAPDDPDYSKLLAARPTYALAAAMGGWRSLERTHLKVGDRGEAVLALRQRLRAEAYRDTPADSPEVFDEPLGELVKAFQARHALEADGVVGPATLTALNVPAGSRLDAIDANLERLRWSPRLTGARVVVDVGGAELRLIRPGQPPLTMRVIVGDKNHQTPLFISALDGVVLNPPWEVPGSIATAELWPKEAKEPGYLARNHISVVDGRLRQSPGPFNSLGVVKFDMESPFGVFLHDTPHTELFELDRRALSHGCIRLQAPRDLAVALLEDQGWTRETLDQAIAAGATRRIAFGAKVPVVLEYRTIQFDPAGKPVFGPDPYGWDKQVAAALRQLG